MDECHVSGCSHHIPLKSLQSVVFKVSPLYTLIGLLFLEPRENAKGLTSS